jgi:hypothetical protein
MTNIRLCTRFCHKEAMEEEGTTSKRKTSSYDEQMIFFTYL